ncbi:MAG: Glyoxylate reductase [Candidatus Thorarchaeota archaeon AB_25]|nr:MAG: Glyoxylate reductase [Candidatus Thorarchaeota archaeon AB_25]
MVGFKSSLSKPIASTMTQKVFVTRKIPQEGLDMITGMFYVTTWPSEHPPSKEEIVEMAADCQGLITLLSDTIDADMITNLPNLKVITQYAVGYDNIDVKEATRRGIIVTNTPGVLTETTADLTWSLIMATARRIVEADRYIRKGNWNVAWGPQLLLGADIYDATLGIIGMGRIGKAVARRAQGFNMRVLFHSRSHNESIAALEELVGAQSTSLDTLLRESDIVSLHVPLTSATIHLIGEKELGIMKKGSILVNTSRGQVVDQDALYRALTSGHLGGAGLDVFTEEPIPKDSPLIGLPNVVLVPHIGSASKNTRATMATMCAKNIIAALNGERPPNIVNPEVL